ATWSTPLQLSDGNNTQGSCAAVGPNGELDVAWYDFSDLSIKFDSSPDGGVTWGTDVKIAQAYFVYHVPHDSFRCNSYPSHDAAPSGRPHRARIYCCGAEAPPDPDALIPSPSDGGPPGSPPIPASDVTPNSQFSPCLDVDANGNVNVGFYDRRDDARNRN